MQTTVTTQAVTTAAEQMIEKGGNNLNVISLIMLIVLLIVCAAAFLLYRKAGKGADSGAAAAKTAQDFINVFDLGDNCLYTVDGMVFVYIKIDGMSLEMFEQNELYNLSKTFATELVSVDFPWKFLSVSRPMDIKETLQNYTELQETSTAGHKALLQQEINELISMTNRGETLERQHYAVLWGKDDKELNLPLRKRADKLVNIFAKNKIRCEILSKEGIKALLNVVNIPAYSSLETRYDFSDELLRAIIQ